MQVSPYTLSFCCLICGVETAHDVRSPDFAHVDAVAHFRCPTCGRWTSAPVTHFSDRAKTDANTVADEQTCCGLSSPGRRVVRQQSGLLRQLTCPRCIRQLVEQHGENLKPDWRADFAIAEDDLAI
jgi:hypothetical protein